MNDLVVDHWTSGGESRSHRDVLLLHDVWTTSNCLSGHKITSTISVSYVLPLNPMASAFFLGESRYAHGLRARWRLCRLLEQLQQPLSASSRQLPRSQPSSWDTGAGRDKRFCVRVLRARLGHRTRFCSDVVGLCPAPHRLFLQQTSDLAQLVVSEYSRSR